MSDTDKTDPWWVKGRWEATERHNHTDGICDLGDIDDKQAWRWRRGQCYWEPNWNAGYMQCPCGLCKRTEVPSKERARIRRQIEEGYSEWLAN